MEDVNVMWTLPQIAERDGISKQAVSKTVLHLIESHDLPVERDARGRVSKVSLAHYDHLRQRFQNPAKTAPAPRPETPRLNASDSFDEAKRQQAWLAVGREKLARQEMLGQLVRRDMLNAALLSAGREIQAVVTRLVNRADDLALAVSKDGVHGLRQGLKDAAFAINSDIAAALERMADVAPANDPLIDDE